MESPGSPRTNMKVYDISREVFSAPVYEGDPRPRCEWICRMEAGGECNLSSLYAGCHNGTHVDAPLHYKKGGLSIDQLDPARFVGPCTVISVGGGLVTAETIRRLPLKKGERVLFRGNGKAHLAPPAAQALIRLAPALVGIDALSIGAPDQEWETHLPLLDAGIPILEGLDLSCVPDGGYILSALPLKLGGLEAAPARAVLLAQEGNEGIFR